MYNRKLGLLTIAVMITFVATIVIVSMIQPMSLYGQGSDKGDKAIAKFNAREAPSPPVHTEISHTTKDAPVSISGDNIYIVWWTNNTVDNNSNNEEIMFRASTDGGQTFGDKINLSNTTDSNSTKVKVDSDANNVVVTWWETNQTSETPVFIVSNDNGKTFGPALNLAINGTINSLTE